MSTDATVSGRLIKAPENFLDAEGVRTVSRDGKAGRRDFTRQAFAAAPAGAALPLAHAQANPLHLGLLRDLQGVFDLDAKVSDCAFQSMDFRT